VTARSAPPGADGTVVLVHGLWTHGLVTAMLERRLRRLGFAVRSCSYPSVGGTLQTNVDRILDCVRGIDAAPLHLVGHSLGGVLVLRAVAAAPWLPPGRIVCLGAPLTGSVAARALQRWPGGPAILGPTLRDAVLDEPLDAAPPGREVGVVAGRIGVGGGLLLGALRPPHDGAVTVAETRLPGITDHRVLPVTHTGMLFSPAVARATAHFLRHGRFPEAADRADAQPRRLSS